MNKKQRERAVMSIVAVVVLTSPLLLIAGGCEIAAFVFGDKSEILDRNGVVATAIVYKVSKDRLGEGLQTNSEYQRGVGSANRSRITHWTLHYRFTANDQTEVTGSYNVQTYEKPELGRELEVRYLASDPSVYETAVGHTESQTAALHWIAFAFCAIWFACIFVSAVKAVVPKKLARLPKRKSRQRA